MSHRLTPREEGTAEDAMRRRLGGPPPALPPSCSPCSLPSSSVDTWSVAEASSACPLYACPSAEGGGEGEAPRAAVPLAVLAWRSCRRPCSISCRVAFDPRRLASLGSASPRLPPPPSKTCVGSAWACRASACSGGGSPSLGPSMKLLLILATTLIDVQGKYTNQIALELRAEPAPRVIIYETGQRAERSTSGTPSRSYHPMGSPAAA